MKHRHTPGPVGRLARESVSAAHVDHATSSTSCSTSIFSSRWIAVTRAIRDVDAEALRAGIQRDSTLNAKSGETAAPILRPHLFQNPANRVRQARESHRGLPSARMSLICRATASNPGAGGVVLFDSSSRMAATSRSNEPHRATTTLSPLTRNREHLAGVLWPPPSVQVVVFSSRRFHA
jgi:hypothetical protein